MRIAITAKGEGLKSMVDDRFGRCENFVIFDTETKETTTVDNDAKNESGGAGGKAVRILSLNKVDVVIAPELGPKATEGLKAFEIKAYKKGNSATVEEAINNYNENKLEEIKFSTVEEHSGLRKA
ncbi:NifB/NifX family molybdenum-iron cluster-binding protein [Haliovirga abyssi]|uniref:Diguanylate cyclase n=1 Tax=Haliovirga abyssi TaxID=2996794 RepID=A0AAU9D9U0_9FUSO|nr:NifB/NifX family molybdenum-iron cluster-binding protein [Haliovirga abyssi]BDU50361.1 diguanylate cyclase [Haliovirga abyssi]